MPKIFFIILFLNIKLVLASNEGISIEYYSPEDNLTNQALKLPCVPEKIFDREQLHYWVYNNRSSETYKVARSASDDEIMFPSSEPQHEGTKVEELDLLQTKDAALFENSNVLMTSYHEVLLDSYEEFLETIDSIIVHEYMEFVDPIPLKQAGGIDYGSVHGPVALFMADILFKAKQAAEGEKNATVIEFGCGGGRNVWKLAATGCRVIANDLYEKCVHESINFAKVVNERLTAHITPDIGDACDFLSRKSEYEGQINQIIAQNLLHYFPPKKLNRFAELAFKSLKAGGEIHILVESMMSEKQKAQYTEAKANGWPFPGYLESASQGQVVTSVKLGNIEDEERIYNFQKPKLTSTFHFLDPRSLTKVFEDIGFQVFETKILDEQCMKELNPEDFPHKHSNIHVILRALKPLQSM